MAEPVVLINAFEVPAAAASRFITAWQRARDHLQAQPGYVDTALHQAVKPNADFQFVNIARWQTAEAFTTAIQSPGFRQAAADRAGAAGPQRPDAGRRQRGGHGERGHRVEPGVPGPLLVEDVTVIPVRAQRRQHGDHGGYSEQALAERLTT